MIIDFNNLTKSQVYFTMIQTLIPRPIAWVLSQHENGKLNLAPFSYFNGVASEPPLLMISAGRKRSGEQKDTWANIEARNSFVVHIPSTAHASEVTQSADSLDAGVSEIEALGIETVPMEGFHLPRLKHAKVAFGCKLHEIIEFGNSTQAMILGEIQCLFVEDDLVHSEGKRLTIDPTGIDPLARLGGKFFSGITAPFEKS